MSESTNKNFEDSSWKLDGYSRFLKSLEESVSKVRLELENLVVESDRAKVLQAKLESYISLRQLIEAMRANSNPVALGKPFGWTQNEIDAIAAAATAIESPRRKRTRTTLGPSRTQAKILDAAALIATQPPAGDEMWFSHSVLCQVSLPRKQVEGTVFERRSGDAIINVQAGFLNVGGEFVQQIVPYGALPRVALAWITTEALRTGSREINIGRSASEFMELIGYKSKSGGPRSTYSTLREQMNALAACNLKFGMKGRTVNAQPFDQFDAWIKDAESSQQVLWPGHLTLSERFSNSLENKCVPLDARAIVALSGSALALDIYTWLANRLHCLSKPQVIEWKPLRSQFGQEYDYKNGSRDFKTEFKKALLMVQEVYPTAKIATVYGGLELANSPPPIAKKYHQIYLGKK